jgi:cobalt/nickel transport system permease protein
MHIPDGYLSPSTCAALYAAAAPFWYLALQKVKRLLSTRLVPLLSVFAAFSFIVMMFNLPLPGGTTGHATGAAIAAIVLGPWGSVLAISVALLIQALFFGDGGITAFGANCFNIAIVASLTAQAIYRLLSGSSAINSSRRVMAAGFAGYLSINLSALLTAIEFGIQPLLFKDATGAPLYAPYGLTVAVPAMMIGQLTFAGLAEAILTAGVVAYLQRTDSALLKMTAPDAVFDSSLPVNQSGWRATRPLWLGVALLMILTPLGLLAAGTAWGEWSADDFKNAATRQQIQQASGSQAPPEKPPGEMEKLSNIWTAPIPDYAPPFLKSKKFGYILSAMFGVGLVILVSLVIGRWHK